MGCFMAPGTEGRICGESLTWHLGIQRLLAGAEFPLLSSLFFLAGLRMARSSTDSVGTAYGERDLGKW